MGKALQPLDRTWWSRVLSGPHTGDYEQQGGRGQLWRMLDSGGRTVSWAIMLDGKNIGEAKLLRDAKILARKLTDHLSTGDVSPGSKRGGGS